MMKKNILNVVCIGMLMVGLSACSGHTNQLKQMDKETAAKFLVSASKHAEKKVGLTSLNAYGYRNCMNKTEKKDVCKQLYDNMITFAKTQEGFKNITVSDLTDPTLWESINEDYQRIAFNSID